MNENAGLSLSDDYGFRIGNSQGVYSWPYGACVGYMNKNDIFSPHKPIDAQKICTQYCAERKKITGQNAQTNDLFNEINNFSKEYRTCEQQCDRIGKSYILAEKFSKELKEGGRLKTQNSNEENEEKYVEDERNPLIYICVIVTIITIILIVQF